MENQGCHVPKVQNKKVPSEIHGLTVWIMSRWVTIDGCGRSARVEVVLSDRMASDNSGGRKMCADDLWEARRELRKFISETA